MLLYHEPEDVITSNNRCLVLDYSWAYPGGGGTGGTGGRLPLFEPRECFEILIMTECFLKLTTVSKLGEFALSVLIFYWFSTLFSTKFSGGCCSRHLA